MDISLDKPGFGVGTTDAEVHFSDPPRLSGSLSTTSGDSIRRSCTKCHGRMSSFSLDKHLFCTKCRGSECSMNSRCDECMQWTEEDMLKYVKLRKSLSSKSKRSKSSPPRSIPHDRDTNDIMPTQLDSVQKLIDDSIATMSVQLMAKFSSMFEQFLSRDTIFLVPLPLRCWGIQPPVLSLRPVARLTESSALRAFDFRRATRIRYRRRTLVILIGLLTRRLRLLGILQGDTGEPQGKRSAPTFVRHHQAGAGFDSQPDEDDDDRDSGVDSAPSDKTYLRLMHYIHDCFPHSVPASAPREHPRCEFEEFFSTSEVASSAKPILTLYPRVDKILDSYADQATRFAKESKPLHRVLPFKRKATLVGDQPGFVWLVMSIQIFLVFPDRRRSYVHAHLQ